jgi:malate dehydrogenase (oxaloacetate-decarboxylating)(NADP+)
VEEFVEAANAVFPGVLIQFEDFANQNAFRLLEKYRERTCCFNDDIQGTAAVALAGLLSALRITGRKLQNEKVLFMGAGEAATGIADLIVTAMVSKSQITHEARRRNWLFDSKGLVVQSRKDLAHHKLAYAHDHPQCTSFLEAVKAIRPTAIIGVAGIGGTFTPEVLKAMADLNARPVVFALSNPTSKTECTASEAYEHTGGRALFACGSPFEPVTFEGRRFVPRQGNNSYIFPGVGLGVIASGARRVTEGMFLAAAEALVARVTEADLAQGSLYPPLASIRDVSAHIAAAVANVAYREGQATVAEPANLLGFIREAMYQPRYTDYLRLKG